MKKIIVFFSVLLVLWACEKPVTIDIPEEPSKLVINGWVGKDSTFIVRIGKTRYSMAPKESWKPLQELYTVKNAVPVIFENNIPVDTLVYNAAEYQYYSARGRKVREGFSYTLKVKADGFTEAFASTIVPSQVAVAGMQRVKNARTNSMGMQEDEITLTLNDLAGEENFYLVQLFGPVYSHGLSYPIYCVRTTDKDIEMMSYDTDPMDPDNCYEGDALLMKDVHFNGNRKVLKLYVESSIIQDYVDPSTGKVSSPFMNVYTITKDHFRFMKSFSIYWSTDENPFAEPVNVFTNVQNGYGVFSAYTKVTDTLR